jgi:hypothetical protein
MTRTQMAFAALVAGLVIAVCTTVPRAAPGPEPAGAAAGAKPADAWEYCELHYRHIPARVARGGFGAGGPGGAGFPGGGGGLPGAPGGGRGGRGGAGPAMAARPAQTTICWITADEEIETKGWDAMATKINAPPAKKNATEASHRLRVLNRLGVDGWELIAHQPRDFPGGDEIWTFKRKARK